MGKNIEIHVPDIGDFADVPVVEVAVSLGDIVDDGDTLLSIESDKATLDVPTNVAGKVAEIKVAEGDAVSQGTLIMIIEAAQDAAETQPEPSAPKQPSPAREVGPAPEADNTAVVIDELKSIDRVVAVLPVQNDPGKPVHASPSIRRFARMLGVIISEVAGTGPKGRVTREDVEKYVKTKLTAQTSNRGGAPASIAGLPDWPQVDFDKFGPTKRVGLSRIAKISGPALARNAMVIPHVTNFESADVTELEDFRKAMNVEAGPDGVKLTMLAFSVKAVVSALMAFPKFNSSLVGDELILKEFWNIGVAADTPDGLVVPVIKNAETKGLRDIALEMKELAGAARAGKLKGSDIQGATFTISSLGGIGGTNFTPIINAPEVAILGMPRSSVQPVWDGTAFQPRLIQPLGLSFDHRVADGVAAAHFLVHVARSLAEFRRILL